MRAFYYENNNNQKIGPPTIGYVLIGELRLDPGTYAVWAKFSIGVNAGGGYPGPAYPHSGGAAILVFGDGSDQTYVGVQPESGLNNETVNLQTVGKSALARRARLYFSNPGYPLPVYINNVRITAVEVDLVRADIAGEDHIDEPEDPEDRMRQAMLTAKIFDMSRLVPDGD